MSGKTGVFRLVSLLFCVNSWTNLFSHHIYTGFKGVISGIILDQEEAQPLPGATVMLLTADNVIIRTFTTGTDGRFSFDSPVAGTYKISISYIGYVGYTSRLIQVADQHTDLGTILLRKDSKMLQGVTITHNKKAPLIQSKSDRIIYNAGADISNKAGTASDVMRKVPLLTVEPDGQLKMRGNSNFKVLLNGIPSPVMAKNLKEALKMIPASSIASIEVITNPSAKYEAEGAAGIINVITKKKMSGNNGSIDLSAGNLEQTGNLALNIIRNKLTYELLLNASYKKEYQKSTMERNSLSSGPHTGTLLQERDTRQRDNGGYAGFTTTYTIDSLQKIGTSISYWTGKWPEKDNLYNRYQTSSQTSEYKQYSNKYGKYNFFDLSLNYQKKFRKPGQELQVTGMWSRSRDLSEYITDQFTMNGTPVFREQSPNSGTSKDWNLQADYIHPLNKSGKHVAEIGVRYTRSSNKNDYSVYNSHLPVDPARSNGMNYFQDIYAFYISTNIRPDSGNWAIRPGLRFEYTKLGASYNATNPPFGVSFSNWVPSLLISRYLNDNQEIKINYTERIRRPWIWDLNPYVDASDPMNKTAGNPGLKPELNRMLELGHSYDENNGFSLNSAIYYNTNSNAIEQITTLDTSGVSFTTSQNIAANKRLGANMNASFTPAPGWSLNAGGEVFYLKFDAPSMQLQSKGTFYNLHLNTTYGLPENFSILVAGEYSNGFITLQGTNAANYSYRLAVRKELFDKKASLTLATNNPFQRHFLQKSTATSPTFESNTSGRFYNRSVTLSFSWQFGGFKERNDNGTSSFDEDNAGPARRKR